MFVQVVVDESGHAEHWELKIYEQKYCCWPFPCKQSCIVILGLQDRQKFLASVDIILILQV